jgi:hypothetical protein
VLTDISQLELAARAAQANASIKQAKDDMEETANRLQESEYRLQEQQAKTRKAELELANLMDSGTRPWQTPSVSYVTASQLLNFQLYPLNQCLREFCISVL